MQSGKPIPAQPSAEASGTHTGTWMTRPLPNRVNKEDMTASWNRSCHEGESGDLLVSGESSSKGLGVGPAVAKWYSRDVWGGARVCPPVLAFALSWRVSQV